MDTRYLIERFNCITEFLPTRIRQTLLCLDNLTKQKTEEIRLRKQQPVCLTMGKDRLFINERAFYEKQVNVSTLISQSSDIEECYNKICGFSIYSHQNEISQGYITLKGGHRAGICGTAVYEKENIRGFKDISSINLRIAREMKGTAEDYAQISDKGVLIAGPPSSGKTTILRDFVRVLSNGINTTSHRVVLIDSRGEIASSVSGVAQNDVGFCTDVINGVSKRDGMEIAIRTMNPQVIAFDEISSVEEVKKISEGLYCGVKVITSIHVGRIEELYQREAARALLMSGAIGYVVLLKQAGQTPAIYQVSIGGKGFSLEPLVKKGRYD